MSIAGLFSLMCGGGGLSISEWARMKSYRRARLWVEGYNKRYDATYHIGYVISRSAVKPWCKNLPKDYPYSISQGADKVIEDMPEMSEEERAARLESMRAEVVARAKNKE